MATFAVLTRLSPEAVREPKSIEALAAAVTQKLAAEVPQARWVASYAVLGPYDYLDIFEAPDHETAHKVAVILRSLGHAVTETWLLTPWDRFVSLVRQI